MDKDIDILIQLLNNKKEINEIKRNNWTIYNDYEYIIDNEIKELFNIIARRMIQN